MIHILSCDFEDPNSDYHDHMKEQTTGMHIQIKNKQSGDSREKLSASLWS
jgi:hypothetical protein